MVLKMTRNALSSKIKSEVYPNSPLVEVVFEIRFPGEPIVECKRDVFFDFVKKDYPQVLVPQIKENVFVALQPYRFEKADKSAGIMLAINRFSYYDRKYSGFASFEREVLNLTGKFKKSFPKINDLARIGFRYVNIIPFTREEGTIPADKFLNLKLQLPAMVSEKFDNLSIGFVVKAEDKTITTRIETLTAIDQNRESILLDIDCARETDLSIKSIEKHLKDSHKCAKRLFEELITDNYRMFLRGQSI